ncbi:MAG: prolipoprotein diacylglyceryl transferase [Candidatus Eisenbacteria sp.]|nr:prolipoprotein diacylglyceryl transferase [Candidatus Eisenbacteria bacterium]
MKPILVEWGPFTIHSYGLALALAFLFGSLWVTRRARAYGYLEADLMYLFWWILTSALVGARIYYALLHPGDFDDDFLEVFRIWRGGLAQYGGLIAAVAVGALVIRARGWRFFELADLLAPALAMGEAVTRIGCFLNGCCFGRPCSLPWAVTFPEGASAYWSVGATPIHPTQLYLCGANLLLFIFLARVGSRLIGTGRVFALFLAGSSLARFFVDFVRYYEKEDTLAVGGLHLVHSQWISLLLIAGAIAIWFLGVTPTKVALKGTTTTSQGWLAASRQGDSQRMDR